MAAIHIALRSVTQVYIKLSLYVLRQLFFDFIFINFIIYLLLTCCHLYILITLLVKYDNKVFLLILFELLNNLCFILCFGAISYISQRKDGVSLQSSTRLI